MRRVLALGRPFALLVALQQGAAARAPQLPSTANAPTLVEIDVIAQDRAGRVVTDLEPHEFVIDEGGRTRVLERVAFIDMAAARPRPPRTFVLVFDEPHLSPESLKRAQSVASSLLNKQFKPGDLVGVFADGRLVGNRLMPDKDAAMKAVRGAHPVSRVESFAMPETFRPICDADRPDCDRSTSDRLRDNATTLADEARASAGTVAGVLPGLIRSLARVDGRKAVLLFSERLAVNDPAQLARDTLDAALRTEARLYIVDPRATGREIDDDGGAADALARDAGGFVVRGSTVADGTLEQVARDLDAYYALGFWTDVDIDGGLHRVTVRTTRADVRLRVWPAYLATGRAAPAAPAGAVRWESVRAARPAAPADPGRRVEAASEPPGSVATGVVVTAPPASGAAAVRVRPTASQNVEHLSAGEWIDTNAEAGWEAYQRGDLESARTSLLAATARPGVLSWVRYALGTANYALGHFADAAAEWERVRDRHPEFEPVYFDLADAYVQLRAREKAIALLRTAQGRWPLDAEIYNDLGTVQASAGSLDDAIKTFEEAVRVVPDESITYLNLAQALELRYVKQVRYIRELRKYLWNERDRDGAIKNYERYLEFGGPYADRARQGLERVKTAPR